MSVRARCLCQNRRDCPEKLSSHRRGWKKWKKKPDIHPSVSKVASESNLVEKRQSQRQSGRYQDQEESYRLSRSKMEKEGVKLFWKYLRGTFHVACQSTEGQVLPALSCKAAHAKMRQKHSTGFSSEFHLHG